MVTCQSANQLKTPAKVSWNFKMVSQFGSLGYTIMGKTADLTVVQKTIIDTLHKEGKPQTLIAKEAGCSQSAVSKHVNRSWVEGKSVEEKDAQPTERENRSLMRIVKQNRFKNLVWTSQGMDWGWGQGIKSHHTQTCQGIWLQLSFLLVKPLLNHRQRQRRLTWAKEKKNWTVAQWSKVLFSDESKFCISFGNQGPRVWRKGGEAHSPSCMKSSVKFPQSVMIWGCNVICWCWSIVFFENQRHCTVYQEIWSTSCFLLLTSFLKMLISFSSRIWHLPTLPKAPKVG